MASVSSDIFSLRSCHLTCKALVKALNTQLPQYMVKFMRSPSSLMTNSALLKHMRSIESSSPGMIACWGHALMKFALCRQASDCAMSFHALFSASPRALTVSTGHLRYCMPAGALAARLRDLVHPSIRDLLQARRHLTISTSGNGSRAGGLA